MKTTVLYFNSESEVKEYAEKNGYKYIDNYLEDRREDAELSAVWAEKVETYNERKATLEAQTASETKGE